MRRTLYLLTASAIALATLSTTGCRTRRLNEGFRGDVPDAHMRGGGEDLDVQCDKEGAGWGGLDESIVTDDAMAAAAREKRWEGIAVYFAYDRATIGASERPKIETLADFMKAKSNYYVIVEGHCDERGSDEYNRALGERRALAVKDYLLSLGIAESRIQTLSYGEERPEIPDATTEAQHAKNRRCEFVLGIE